MTEYQRRIAATKIGKAMAWEYAAFRNYKTIEDHIWEAYAEGKTHPDLMSYTGSLAGKPAIVLGSGPSLDSAVPYLKDWEGAILCGPTQALVLRYAGITPSHLFLVDPMNTPKQMGMGVIPWKDTMLVTTPTVNPYIVEGWEGERAYFRIINPAADIERHITDMALTWTQFVEKYKPKGEDPVWLYMADEQTIFADSVLTNVYARSEALHPAKDRLGIRQQIMHAGCTPNIAILVAAHVFRADPIFLVGVDNGFVRGLYRAVNYAVEEGPSWRMLPRGDVSAHPEKEKVFKCNGVATVPQLFFYNRLLLNMVACSEPADMCVIEAARPGDYGIAGILPKADIADVVKMQGLGFKRLRQPRRQRMALYQRWQEEWKNVG